jgi:hypothetical protein
MKLFRKFPAFIALANLLAISGVAQWPKYSVPGIPRHPDGTPNLEAPAPRSVDGKPDLSGTWESLANSFARDVTDDQNPDILVPAARPVYREHLLTLGKEAPPAACLPPGLASLNFFPPTFLRIVQAPNLTAILYGGDTDYLRIIYTDGRKLPENADPAWLGYSVGHWEKDTFVVESSGFNDRAWIDFNGHPQSESLRVTERFQRHDFGHMELEMIFDDPKVFARPFSIKGEKVLRPDYAIPEGVCENNRDTGHLAGGNGFQMGPEQLARYAGVYEFAPGRQVSLTVSDIFLIFQERPGGVRRTLVPQSEKNFVFRDNGDELVFEDSSGAVTAFTENRASGNRKATRASPGDK